MVCLVTVNEKATHVNYNGYHKEDENADYEDKDKETAHYRQS